MSAASTLDLCQVSLQDTRVALAVLQQLLGFAFVMQPWQATQELSVLELSQCREAAGWSAGVLCATAPTCAGQHQVTHA